MDIYIDPLIDQHKNAIKMLEEMKLMYTKNEPGAKPCYTEFMFVDDEIFDDELFEELLDPDYKLYDEIQDMEVDDEING